MESDNEFKARLLATSTMSCVTLTLLYTCGVFFCVLAPALVCILPLIGLPAYLILNSKFSGKSLNTIDLRIVALILVLSIGLALVGSGWIAPVTFLPAVILAGCVCVLC